MKLAKIFLSLVCVMIATLIGGTLSFVLDEFQVSKNDSITVQDSEDKKIIQNEISNEMYEDEQQANTNENIEKNINTSESFSASNEVNSQMPTNNATTPSSNSNNPPEDIGNQINTQNNQQEKANSNVTSSPQQEQTSWEKLGITEYEYYNTPDTKWKKVTHSNITECKKAGDVAIEIKYDENGLAYQDYQQYWCYDVISYSGKYLGAMLSLKKI